MKIICAIMASDYNKPEWGESFEMQTFYRFFQGAGYQTILFDFGKEFKKSGTKKMTADLINLARRERARIIFAIPFQEEFDLSQFRALSVQETAVIGWGCDDDWRWDDYAHKWAENIHYWVTTYPEIHERVQNTHPNVLLAQWACNPYVFKKKDLPKKYDVSFVGINYGDRGDLVKALRDRGVKVTTFGRGWGDNSPGRVTVEGMVDVFNQSRINLNFTRSWRKRRRQIKARIFEVVGCGGFLITEFGERLDEFLVPGQDLVMFDTREELVEKVLHYLEHDAEREAIADSGYRKVQGRHLYTHRFADIFNRVHGNTLAGAAGSQ